MWNGLPVDQVTDTDTGVTEIYSSGLGGDLLATGDAKGNWKYNDQAGFRRRYNNIQRNKGKKVLSQEDFNRTFFTEGTKIFNNDRASVLNSRSNYANTAEYEEKSSAHFKNGLPDVKDPKTEDKNNSNGDPVSDPENSDTDSGIGNDDGWLDIEPSPIVDEGPRGGSFRYPIGEVPDLGYDYVVFGVHRYEPGGAKGLITSTGFERIGGALESITLPLLPSIDDTNSVDWGGDKMNELQNIFAGVAARAIGSDGVAKGLSNLVSGTKDAADTLINKSPGAKDALIAYFAGQAVGANVLGRSTGQVLNPNLELLFKGPQLRNFNFNFRFRPRSPEESEQIRSIIRTFKIAMAPKRTTGNLFLRTPDIFTIKYMHNGGAHQFMNRIKPCALKSMKVNYTPDNNYMTYTDGALTGYDLSLSFGEIVPIYADDQQNVGGMGY